MNAPTQLRDVGQSPSSSPANEAVSPYLPPVGKPRGLMLKLSYTYTRRNFGQVPGPLSVFCARMPTAFTRFYLKAGMLERKIGLEPETAVLIRGLVASTNGCGFCMDANRWSAINKAGVDAAKLDALGEYRTSFRFTDRERAALAFADELTRERQVSQSTFADLANHYSEREICEIVFLIASEHLNNINNIALNIGSAGRCQASTLA